MFSGLYGDLPQAKNEPEAVEKRSDQAAAGTWSGTGLLVPSLHGRPMASGSAMAPPSVLRSTVPRGNNSRGRGGARPTPSSHSGAASSTPLLTTAKETPGSVGIQTTSAATAFGEGIEDEYDPSRPNDYEEMRRHKEQQRLHAEAEAEKQERLRELRELEALEERRILSSSDIRQKQQQGQVEAAVETSSDIEALRRAVLHVSGDEAFLRRGGLSIPRQADTLPTMVPTSININFNSDAVTEPAQADGGPKGMSLAQRMLEKMGWKEGEGLGRHKQGIAAPLMVQKTDIRSGRVVASEAPILNALGVCEAKDKATPVDPGPPSRVIVLRNVVGPGGIDESLDEEIGLECSKHGEVLSVLIFEVIEPDFPPDEAVRVYVQFETQAAADAALADLHGRFFGGRRVKAAYFDEGRFESIDLAPTAKDLAAGR